MLCIIQEGDSMFYLRGQSGFFKYEVVDTKDGVAYKVVINLAIHRSSKTSFRRAI